MMSFLKMLSFQTKLASGLGEAPQTRVKGTRRQAGLTRRFLVWGAFITSLVFPCYAGFQVQRLQQIPAEPYQQLVASKTDSQGNLIVVVAVSPPEFYPSIQGLFGPGWFGLVKKIDTAGNELFSRILPGAFAPGSTPQIAIAIDGHDDIYVAGATNSPEEFPFTSLLPTGFLPIAFLMKLHGQDGTLAYSTAWGGGFGDSIVVDSAGQALVSTSVLAALMPTTPGAYASPPGRSLNAPMYLTRFSAAGDKILFAARYSGQTGICYGGSSCTGFSTGDGGQVLLDSKGNIWVAGTTNYSDMPLTPNALKKTCGCANFAGDGFLAEFSGDGSQLLYATYFGTSPGDALGDTGNDVINAAAFDGAGHLWFAGYTNGADLPVTANAPQKKLAGGTDGFIAEYDPASNQLLYMTYFGGTGDDSITNLEIQPDGTINISGNSNSKTLPGVAAGFLRGTDFVASIDPHTYAISALTRFPNGSAGTGLAATPTGLMVSGTSNVAAFLEESNASSPSIYAVVNSAGSAATGQVAPGELISIYGANLASVLPATADLSSGQAPTKLGVVEVLVNGTPAPVLSTQLDQINAIVPFGIYGTSALTIAVSNEGVPSNEARLGFQDAAPEAFKTNAKLWAVALNEDGTVNSIPHHAKLGSVVTVLGTGFGSLFPPPQDGHVLTGTLPQLAALVQVLYEGLPLDVISAGPAPAMVAGDTQVSFRLPTFTGTSTPAFHFLVSGWPSGDFIVLVEQ